VFSSRDSVSVNAQIDVFRGDKTYLAGVKFSKDPAAPVPRLAFYGFDGSWWHPKKGVWSLVGRGAALTGASARRAPPEASTGIKTPATSNATPASMKVSCLLTSPSPSSGLSVIPYRDRATALEAGRYQLVVSDMPSKAGFRLVGPRMDTKTGRRFRGTVQWKIRLRPAPIVIGRAGRSRSSNTASSC
jgi:hypothetical protein